MSKHIQKRLNASENAPKCSKTSKTLRKFGKFSKMSVCIGTLSNESERVRTRPNASKRAKRVRMHPRMYDDTKNPTKNFENSKKIARIFSEAPLKDGLHFLQRQCAHPPDKFRILDFAYLYDLLHSMLPKSWFSGSRFRSAEISSAENKLF